VYFISLSGNQNTFIFKLRSVSQQCTKISAKKMDNGLIYIIRIKGKPFFNDIRRALPNINSRTLSTRLKEFSSINPTGGLSEWTKLLIKTIE